MGYSQNNIKSKNNNIEEPYLYLGAIFKKKEWIGQMMQMMTSQEYINNAIENLENKLNKKWLKLDPRACIPMAMVYQPEIGSYPELDQGGIITFQ